MDQMQIIFYLFFVYDDLHAVDFKCIVLHKEKITTPFCVRTKKLRIQFIQGLLLQPYQSKAIFYPSVTREKAKYIP